MRFFREEAVRQAAAFEGRLQQAKSALPPDGWDWYPYASLTNAGHLHRLLGSSYPELEEFLCAGRVLDVGCADAELALFLESLGAQVTAVDHAATHHNGLRGPRELIRHFGSGVTLHDWDLDQSPPPALAGTRFDLALLLGLLYHLQNPLLTLQAVSKLSRHAVISTRVLHGHRTLDKLAVAYLLNEDELNADNSNFWLPTVKGLERMFRRSGWELGKLMLLESKSGSNDPFQKDTRAFAVIRSTHALGNIVLGEGWHELEDDWRWTAPTFSFTLPAFAARVQELSMEVYAHPGLFARGPVAVSLNGQRVALLRETGHLTIRAPFKGSGAQVRIAGRVEAPAGDPRELGIIVKRVYAS